MNKHQLSQKYKDRFSELTQGDQDEQHAQYCLIKAKAESQVVRWQWATDAPQSLEPFYFEEHNFAQGEWLESEPKELKGYSCYGFDANEQIVIERAHYMTFPKTPDVWQFYETFMLKDGDVIESIRYDYSAKKELQNYQVFEYEFGKLQCCFSLYKGSYMTDQYTYEQNLLINKRATRWEEADGEQETTEYLYTYNADGLLARIETEDGAILFQKRPQELTKEMLNQFVLNYSVETIINAFEKKAVALQEQNLQDEPIYALFMQYGSDYNMPPDELYLGFDALRQECLADGSDMLWQVTEYYDAEDADLEIAPVAYDSHIDDDTLSKLSLYQQEIAMLPSEEADEAYSTMMLTCGKMVRESLMTDSKGLNLITDFVVVPLHYEGHDLRENLKAVNSEQYEAVAKSLPEWS